MSPLKNPHLVVAASLLLVVVVVVGILVVSPRPRDVRPSGGSITAPSMDGARQQRGTSDAFEVWDTEQAGPQAFLPRPVEEEPTSSVHDPPVLTDGEGQAGASTPSLESSLPDDPSTTPTLTGGTHGEALPDGEFPETTENDVEIGSEGTGGEGGGTARQGGSSPREGSNGFARRGDTPREDLAVISGRVLRGEDPVPDALMRLIQENDSTQTSSMRTGEDGVFTFVNLDPGVWVLILTDPPAPSNIRRIVLETAEERLGEDFLVPALPRVQGEVLDSQTGSTIPRAHLDIFRGGNLLGNTTSRNDGSFELPHLDADTYRLEGTAEGYLKGEQTFTIPASGETGPVFLRLDPSPNLEVLVLGGGGSPISGARGALFGSAVFGDAYASQGVRFTGGNGSFTIALPSNPGLGSYRVGAWREGYVPAYSAAMSPYTVPENGPLVVQLDRGGTITGQVVDEEDDTPLPGVEVAVTGGFTQTAGIFQRFSISWPSTTTDSEGQFELPAIEPGNTRLTFSLEGYHPAHRDVAVPQGRTDAGRVTLEPSERSAQGRISGIIVDEMGRGLHGHGVYIRHVGTGKSWETRTSANGNFSFEKVDDGDFILFTNGSVLRGDDFMTMDQTYPFLSSGGESVYLIYDLTQSIRMRVVDSAGQPVRRYNVGVILREEGALGNGGRRESFGMSAQREIQSSDGRGVIHHLLSGGVEQLTIKADGATRSLSGLRIPVAGVLDLGDVVLQTGGSVVGVVLDGGTGNTLSGVNVRAEAPAGAPTSHPLASLPITTVTTAGGVFELKGIPGGPFDLVLTKPGLVTVVERLSAEAGQITDAGVFTMESAGTLAGVVIDGAGRPLTGARISLAGISLYSDSEGRFFSNSLPAGLHTVTASHPSWPNQTLSVVLSPDQEAFLEFHLGNS